MKSVCEGIEEIVLRYLDSIKRQARTRDKVTRVGSPRDLCKRTSKEEEERFVFSLRKQTKTEDCLQSSRSYHSKKLSFPRSLFINH